MEIESSHLHFTYGVPEQGEARAKQLPGVGWRTDSSPYFCTTFPVNDGRTELAKALGSDTKRQYEVISGPLPENGEAPDSVLEPEQEAQAASVAIMAEAAGVTVEEFLKDGDLYGSMPSPPLGEYERMSTIEMMLVKGNRHMEDAQWHNSLAKAHIRSLWVDYLRVMGVGNYLSESFTVKRSVLKLY